MNKVRHIYFVHLLNDNSGSPRVLNDAINSLRCSEYNKTVFTNASNGFLSNVSARKVIVPYRLFHNKVLKLFFFTLSQVITFFLLSFYLILSKVKGENTIVVVNTMLPFGAALSSKFFADKTIYYIHETMVNPQSLKRMLLFFVDFCSDLTLFVSKYVLDNTEIKSNRKLLLYNGLRSDFKCNRALDLLCKYNSRKVLFVGSLRVYKGIEQYLKLAGLLNNFNFIAALNCSPSELDEFLRGRELSLNINFYIRPNNLIELYENASLVVNFSIPDLCVETFGLSLLEGMSFGCPVIGPPVGGPAELIDSKAGALIDSRKLIDVVDFINFIHRDFNGWREFSDGALKRSEYFSSQSYSERFSSLIQEEFDSISR